MDEVREVEDVTGARFGSPPPPPHRPVGSAALFTYSADFAFPWAPDQVGRDVPPAPAGAPPAPPAVGDAVRGAPPPE